MVIQQKHSPFTGNKLRKIVVFGAGKSGMAVVKKLPSKLLFVSEAKPRIDSGALKVLHQRKIPFEVGGHTKKAIKDADIIIVSPGVPLDIPVLRSAQQMNIPIIGEIELAFAFLNKPIIAVTGTNGKTTTTALLGKMLRDHGYKAAVAGNIGFPLISVNDSNLDFIVAEVSSYQLETINSFRPKISIILNITPDHLTRHGSMREYASKKASIFRNQGKNDFLIYNNDDRLVKKIVKTAKCRKIPFSLKEKLKRGTCLKDNAIWCLGKKLGSVKDIRIKGEHNIENSMAAATAARLCRVTPASIKDTLQSFRGVEHRIEFVRKANGVSFYNDSKGTNPDSTIVAIKALRPLHDITLILGGRDKMTDLSSLSRTIKKDIKNVVLIGEAKDRFRKNLLKAGFRNIFVADKFKKAIERSYKLSSPGDAVLLSPACASFDMFSNYEERGKVFKKIVANI